jgi:hypothetical protein
MVCTEPPKGHERCVVRPIPAKEIPGDGSRRARRRLGREIGNRSVDHGPKHAGGGFWIPGEDD